MSHMPGTFRNLQTVTRIYSIVNNEINSRSFEFDVNKKIFEKK